MTDAHWLRYFPEEPRPGQNNDMEKIYNALIVGKPIIFEGACGTGKTLVSLAPSLAVAEENNKVVVIATRVHQQMEQFIIEAGKINKITGINAIVLKGKEHMCPLKVNYEVCEKLREDVSNILKKEERKDLERRIKEAHEYIKKLDDSESTGKKRNDAILKLGACPYLLKTRLLKDEINFGEWLFNCTRNPDEKFAHLNSVRHPIEVVDYAKEKLICPSEMVKSCLPAAELIICNYEYLLNRNILQYYFFESTKRHLDDIILVFDEAHNLEEAARKHANFTLSEKTISQALGELFEQNRDIDLREGELAQKIKSELETVLVNDTGVTATLNSFALYKFMSDTLGMDMEQAQDIMNMTLDKSVLEDAREFLVAIETSMKIFEVDKNKVAKTVQDNEEIYVGMRPPSGGKDRFLRELRTQCNELENKALRVCRLGYAIESYKRITNKHAISDILSVARFMLAYLHLENTIEYYPTLKIKGINGKLALSLELFCCVPRRITKPLMDNAYGVVLMSATLQPFQMVTDTLGVVRDTEGMISPLSFPENRRLTLSVATSKPLISINRGKSEIKHEIKNIIADVVNATPGNVLVLLANKNDTKTYYKTFAPGGVRPKDIGNTTVLIDDGHDTENVKQQFCKIGESGGKALLFSYIWGTLTEGVDFKGDKLRSVIVVGLPLPRYDDPRKAIQHAYNKLYNQNSCNVGWNYGVQYPAVRRARQAIGRAVRDKTDFGVRVLVDSRYDNQDVREAFSGQEQEEIHSVEPTDVEYWVEEFFNQIDENYP